jgi:hypothetical protein
MLLDQDVALIVTDGGEPYVLHCPFKLTSAGWISSGIRNLPSRRLPGSKNSKQFLISRPVR